MLTQARIKARIGNWSPLITWLMLLSALAGSRL